MLRVRLSVLETSLSLYKTLMKRERLDKSSLRPNSALKKTNKNYSYISGENVNVYPGKSQDVCGQYVVSRAQVSKGPPNHHQRTSSN